MIAMVFTCWASMCSPGAFAPVDLYQSWEECRKAADDEMAYEKSRGLYPWGQFSISCSSTIEHPPVRKK